MRDAFHTTDVLADRLTELCRRYPAVEPELLRAVLDTVSEQSPVPEIALLHEIALLGRTVAAARAEIAALRADETPVGDIGAAGSELAAVVSHAAAATDAILDACELLDQEACRLPGDTAATLQAATTQIYEACSFQDINGQRLAKVMGILRVVEAKVDQIVMAFGRQRWADKHEFLGRTTQLNGPQLPGVALVQADIDALLAF